ncbi:MAG TPA: hypothetical protein VJR29_03550 [bacterium]|nr:hypothetical protein [bacterium]
MGKNSSAAMVILACLALASTLQAASSTTTNDSDDELVINSNVSGVITGPACQPPSGGMTVCRWDNIQVEYVQSRLIRWNATYTQNLIIKGKYKEINLNFQVANAAAANAVASCERMASSSLAGLGLLSFYANVYTSAGAELEAGFKSSKITVHVDSSPQTYLELGCFLTGN